MESLEFGGKFLGTKHSLDVFVLCVHCITVQLAVCLVRDCILLPRFKLLMVLIFVGV